MAENEHESRAAVEITRIVERNRMIRWGFVTVGMVACTWLVTDAVVKLLDQPPWLVLALALISGVAPGSVPMIIAIRWARRHIRRLASRNAELEKRENPTRSSSELNPDGTYDHD